MNVLATLNNREIAAAIWLLIALVWALFNGNIRHALLAVLKAFVTKKIIVPFALMVLYILAMILCFERFGFWNVSATKDTIIWATGSAFITFVNLNKVAQDERYFESAILDNVKFTVILEFIINLYVFSLIIELVLLPVISLLVVLNAVVESKPEYKRVKTLLNSVLGLLGLVVIVFTVREILIDMEGFVSIENLKSFFLPLLFTLTFLPFVYLVALYIQYESLFVRVNVANKSSDLAKFAKWKIFTTCHVDLSKLTRLSKNAGFPRVSSKDEVLALIKRALN